jgi:hypothetical protein
MEIPTVFFDVAAACYYLTEKKNEDFEDHRRKSVAAKNDY